MKIAILAPTYNEKDNIPILIKKLVEVSNENKDVIFNLHVIDDNSPDGTLQVVNNLINDVKTDNFELSVISRLKKEGLGKAYIDGFQKMLKSDRNYDFILQMDADLSHDPIYIKEFINAAKDGADLIVGSRYIEGGSVPDWSWYRRMLSKFGNLYARTILGSLISDYTGGYNMYSVSVLKKLDFSLLDNAGYGFLITLKYNMLKVATQISQVPIVFLDRAAGESKMPLNTLVNNFKLVLLLKMGK
jgi:dolichol-phosphate mannosyltransferase